MTVLIDSCVFFGFYSLRDKFHMDSIALLMHALERRWGSALITNHVVDEVLTSLKYRISPEAALSFLTDFLDSDAISIVYTDEETERKAMRLFKQHVRRAGLSYTDATTVVVMEELNIGMLLTYDMRSFAGLVENILGPGYWASLPREERDRISRLLMR